MSACVCLDAFAQSAPADAASVPTSTGLLASLLVPLLLVSIAAVAAWWLIRQRGSLLARGGPIQLKQIVALGPRERLLLVEYDGEVLLLGSTASQITLLTQRRVADVRDSHTPPSV